MPSEKITITPEPAKKVPPIIVYPGDKPGEARRRSTGGRTSNPQADKQAQAERERLALLEQQRLAQQKAQQDAINKALADAKQQQITTQAYLYKQGTQENYYQPNQIQLDVPLSTQDQVYKKQTGTIKDTSTGRNIPTYEYRVQQGVVDEQGNTRTGELKNNLATAEQIKQYQLQTNDVIASNKPYSKVGRLYGETKGQASQILYDANKNTSDVLIKAGATETNIAKIYGGVNKVAFAPFGNKVQSFVTNAETSFTYGLVEKPFTNLALFGTGKVIGLGVGATGTALSSIPKAGATAGKIFRTGEVFGGTALGGAYAYDTANKIYNAKSSGEAGTIFGNSIRDSLLFSSGYTTGQKNYQQLQGLYRTRGRTEIPQDKIIPFDVLSGKNKFPLQPKSKTPSAIEQMNLFKTQSQRVPGIKDPMAFHSTPNKFYNNKLSVDTPGTSELLGLYGSYGISPHFLKIEGSGSSLGFNFKSILQPYGKPGSAGIIPTKFVFGKSAKPGQAYVPGIKTEVEAIFPLGTKADLINNKYYYKFNGVRIPLDIFKAQKGTTTPGTQVKDILSSSSYGDLPKSSKTLTSFSSSESKPSKTSSVYIPKSSVLSSISSNSNPISSGRSGRSSSSTKQSYSSTSNISSVTRSSFSKSSISRPSRSYGYYSSIKAKPRAVSVFKTAFKTPKQQNTYSVFGRRKGKFKLIGKTSNLNQAFSIGTNFGNTTLGRTFSIKSSGGLRGLRTPFGYYRKQGKFGNLFIEKGKNAINTTGEVFGLRQSRRKKGLNLF